MLDLRNTPGKEEASRRSIGAVACVLLMLMSCLVGIAVGSRAQTPGVTLANVDELAMRLGRMERQLEDLAVPTPTAKDAGLHAPRETAGLQDGDRATRGTLPPAAATAPGNERRDGLDTQRVLAALMRLEDDLRQELDLLREAIEADAAQAKTLNRLRDRTGPIDWLAWQEVLDLWDADPDAARAEVKLLTDTEVIDRFGPPTDVWSNTNGITWQYARDLDPVTERYGLDIILRMPAGYVTQLAVRRF